MTDRDGRGAGELVGRAAERAMLVGALDAGVGGQLGMLLLDGEAGAGKTVIVLDGAARSGLPVLQAAAQEGRTAGFDLLGRLVRQLPRVVSNGLLTARDQERLARQLAVRLVEHADGRGLLVLLDDLQWADGGTLAVLPCLAELLANTSVLLIGAYRSEEIGRLHGLRVVRARLRRTAAMRELSLAAMPDHDLRHLVLRCRPDLDAAIVEGILVRADGVPFYAVELAAAVEHPGQQGQSPSGAAGLVPETLRDAIALRVAPLDAGARHVLEVAAVIGVVVPMTLLDGLRDVWASDGPDPATALDALIDAGLLVGDDVGVRFRHSLLREVVCASLPGHRRRALHLQVARLIDATAAAPLEVARHAEAAREAGLARRALLDAAAEDLRRHAYRDAARTLAAALEWWPDPEEDAEARLATVDQLAGCLEQTGRQIEALALLAELATQRHERGDRSGEAAARQRIARVAEQAGHWTEALRAREEAAALFSAMDQPSAAAAERLAAGMALRTAGSFTASLPMLAAARQDALRSADPGLLARVEALYGNVLTRTGHPDGVEHVKAALHLALEHGLSSVAAEVYHRLGDSLEQRADYSGAQAAYSAAVEYCDSRGLEAARQLCRACAGYVLFQRGQWDHAATVDRAVLEAADSSSHARAAAAVVLGLVLALRGQTDRARPILLDGAAFAHHGRVLGAQILAAWGLAVLAEEHACHVNRVAGTTMPDRQAGPAGEGPDDEAAVAAARALLSVAAGTDECHYAIPSLQWSVVTFARHGRLPEARMATARLASIARTVGHGEAYAAWTHAQAEMAWLEHDVKAAASAARRALHIADGTGVAYSSALLASRAAEILLHIGQVDTGLATLYSARRVAQRLRALPLLHHIDATLTANGEVAGPRLAGSTLASAPNQQSALTEREAEVMTLVSHGHTSKQIASRLFLSPRTVDMHVRNSMIKLDCRTRTQAATRFLTDIQ